VVPADDWVGELRGSACFGADEGAFGVVLDELGKVHDLKLILLLMESTPAREQEKLTITELQRYLPLQPPASNGDLPENIKKYLGSSSFNNFSLKEQSKIRESLRVAYRNYYPLGVIVDHLSKLTSDRFTRESIEQALCNCAFKYELIDWFLFVRIVSSGEKEHAKPEKSDAAALIQRQYRIFWGKKRVLNGRQEVETIKRGLE
jgi:hypothetical protein